MSKFIVVLSTHVPGDTLSTYNSFIEALHCALKHHSDSAPCSIIDKSTGLVCELVDNLIPYIDMEKVEEAYRAERERIESA